MKKLLPLILIVVLFTACTTNPAPTASNDEVGTKVAQILTTNPTNTQAVPLVITATPGGPTKAATQPAPTQPVPTQPPAAASATPVPPTATLAPTKPAATGTTAPTATTGASATPQPPTATPQPSPTFSAGDPRTSLGAPSWRDTMANSDNWPTGVDAAGFTSIEFKDSALRLTALKDKDGWRITFDKLTNFYLEMTVKTGACKTNDRYGLIFRVPVKENPDRGYLAGLTCDGRYSLRKWDGPNNAMTGLFGWKANAAIKSGANATNRLGVMVKGGKITMYANGVQLGEVTDLSFKEGYFGVFAGAIDTANFTIAVDEVAYWEQ